ncbi:hypothetical protein C6Q21_11830 [Burkholderia multivorans]|nr:hypothetical protein C6Q21_11830 [Burkholderia multivorans]
MEEHDARPPAARPRASRARDVALHVEMRGGSARRPLRIVSSAETTTPAGCGRRASGVSKWG